MKLSKLPFLVLLIFVLSAENLFAATIQDQDEEAEKPFQVSLNAGFCDKYLWRGITYNQKPVFQPQIDLTYKDFYLSTWGNFGLMKETESFQEIDFTLGYYHSFNTFDIEAYASYFHYIDAPDDNTAELNVGAYYPLGDFTLFARSSFDFIAYTGAMFGEIGCDYEKEISDKFSAFGTLLAGFGSRKFNETYLEINKGAFNLVGGKAGISYSPFNSFYIDADFLLNFTIDKDVKEYLGGTSSLIEIILRKEF